MFFDTMQIIAYKEYSFCKGGVIIFSKRSLAVVIITGIIVYAMLTINPGVTRSKENNTIPNEKGFIGEIDIKVIKEKKTGQITSLPWENDAQFLDSMAGNKDMVLMAGFQTVLKDPFLGEEDNVRLGASLLSGKIIEPGEVFSQNQAIGPYDETKGFKEGPTYTGTKLISSIGGGVCKIASTLYNVAVLSDLEIVQRHHHSMPVSYVPYGQDATVYYGSKDFRFKNNTLFPIVIWAQGIDNVLYIGFYGKEKPPKVEWHHEITNIQKAPTVYKENSELSPGVEKTVVKGLDGATVKSHVMIIRPDGTTEKKDMGTSQYWPMSNIIEKAD